MLLSSRAGQTSQALQAWSCHDHPGVLHSSPHHALMSSCSPSKREGCAMVLLLWLNLLSISQALGQEQCQMTRWPHTWQGVESCLSCCLSSMGSRTENAQVLCLKRHLSLDAAEQCQEWDCSMPSAFRAIISCIPRHQAQWEAEGLIDHKCSTYTQLPYTATAL